MIFRALRSRIVVPMGQEEGKKETEKGRKERSWSFQNRFLYDYNVIFQCFEKHF